MSDIKEFLEAEKAKLNALIASMGLKDPDSIEESEEAEAQRKLINTVRKQAAEAVELAAALVGDSMSGKDTSTGEVALKAIYANLQSAVGARAAVNLREYIKSVAISAAAFIAQKVLLRGMA